MFKKIDVWSAIANPKPDIKNVLPGLPRGLVGVLVGAGGASKSFYAQQMMFQVAAGSNCDFNLGEISKRHSDQVGRVIYVSLEDPEDIIRSRLHDIGAHYTSTNNSQYFEDVARDFIDIISLAGEGVSIIDPVGQLTEEGERLFDQIRSSKHTELIVFDTFRRTFDGDENDGGLITKVLKHFEKLAKEIDAAILLIHHENKAGIANRDAGAEVSRGSSVIVFNSRWVARIRGMHKEEAEKLSLNTDISEHKQWAFLEQLKVNHGPRLTGDWLKRNENGVLEAASPATGKPLKLVKTKGGRL